MADEMHESIHPDRMWINIENRLVIPLQCPTSISVKEVFSLKWIWLINVFLQHNLRSDTYYPIRLWRETLTD